MPARNGGAAVQQTQPETVNSGAANSAEERESEWTT